MKKILSFFLVVCLCIGMVGFNFSSAGEASAASTHVHHIVTNPGENCSTSMNIGFLADTGYTKCNVQYTTADDTGFANAKTQSGSYKSYGASSSSNPFYGKSAKNDSGTDITQSYTFLDYSVTLSGLTPDTNYIYRIYDGSAYSDTYAFKTAGVNTEWSFVVTGDFHEYYANYGAKRAAQATKAINAAASLATQKGFAAVEHVVSVGDIVAWGVDYNQWQNVYNQSWIKKYSFANSIGNHDAMDRSANYTNEYNAIMANYPKNGYSGQMGTCFYYIYNNVLFIYISYLDTSATAQSWVDSVCTNLAGQYKYSVLVNHRPATSKTTGKTYSYFWNYWADNCDKNKIDLVLAGDHHCYMRTYPYYNGSKLSGYSASKPDATVYIAADSSDGERGVATSDVSSSMGSSAYVDSYYFRSKFGSNAKDTTAILVNVREDRMTTEFVYYENTVSAASSSAFYEGSVSGHSSFYYGDTSYVYPSDHGYTPPSTEPENPNVPAAAMNYLASANGGKYMYDTTAYPGGASYYTYAYYGDNSSQGGAYMTGKLNDGVLPADSNPGTSNNDWSVFFTSNGTPTVTLQLPSAVYLNNISLVYRAENGNYGNAAISGLQFSENGSSYKTTSSYTTKTSVASGSNSKITLNFNAAVKAKYIKFTIPAPAAGSRIAVGEMEVWGDTTLPDGANPNIPAATKNLASAANGATYMYPTTIYPGGSSYVATAHYGDNANAGGNYFAGKLNDGTVPADSNPGSANVDWATWFSAHGTPEVTFKLSETAYLNNMSIAYRTDIDSAGFYGAVVPGSVQVSLDGTSFSAASDYTSKVSVVNGGINKITLSFASAYKAAYVKFTIAAPADGGTRFAVGEVQIWGDATLPEGAQVFELIDNSTFTLKGGYVSVPATRVNPEGVSEQFKCTVSVFGKDGKVLAATTYVGTGCKVAMCDADGNIVQFAMVVVSGDVDGDAFVTTTDYIKIKADLKNDPIVKDCYGMASDIDGDNTISTTDLLLLKGII